MEAEITGCTMGKPYSIRHPLECHPISLSTGISDCLRENLPLTCRAGAQSTLGYPEVNMDLKIAGEYRKRQILELEEWRDKAYHSASIYKERTKRWHDKRLKPKSFNPGDKVLLFNSRVKLFGHGKLRSNTLSPRLKFLGFNRLSCHLLVLSL